jgi:hypothetical protein
MSRGLENETYVQRELPELLVLMLPDLLVLMLPEPLALKRQPVLVPSQCSERS